MCYNAETKHVSASGPGLLYIKDVPLWRGWKDLCGTVAPKLTKNVCHLQNCINETTKSFKKVCGTM